VDLYSASSRTRLRCATASRKSALIFASHGPFSQAFSEHCETTNTGWCITRYACLLSQLSPDTHSSLSQRAGSGWVSLGRIALAIGQSTVCTLLLRWSTENKSWPELLHWSVEDSPTAWMSSTLSGQWLRLDARRCSVKPRKSDATVSTTEHSRLYSCWWTGIIFSTSWSFRLLRLGYLAGFGVWRPMTSVCKSTEPQRGNQKQVEGGHHRNRSKIHCTTEKNDWMRLESRMAVRFSLFPLFDWISISCSETCWNYWLFCSFRTPNTFFAYSTVKTKAYEVIIYCILFSYDSSFKMLFFCLNFKAVQHHCEVDNVFYESPGIV